MILKIQNARELLEKANINPENPVEVNTFVATFVSTIASVTVNFVTDEIYVLNNIGEEDLNV